MTFLYRTIDVKNAFPHRDLQEEVYMEQHLCFVTQREYGKACKIEEIIEEANTVYLGMVWEV